MLKQLFALIAIVAMTLEVSAQTFQGTLEFTPVGCEATRNCVLKNDFGFIDGASTGWITKAGDQTDGASIPDWAQPYVGKPFEEGFIKAAVIHDHYCGRHVRPWLQTHRAFYEGLIASGVEKSKALTMYYAVLIGGPKWIELIPPQPCGPNCVFKVATTVLPADGKIITKPTIPGKNLNKGNRRLYVRPARYNSKQIQQEIREASEVIEKEAKSITLAQLYERAKKYRPNDLFFTAKGSIAAGNFVLGEVE